MYKIIILLPNQSTDGPYRCECVIQDGTERWSKQTLDEAIKSLKQAAKVYNGVKIKNKDIEIYEQQLSVPKFEYIKIERK